MPFARATVQQTGGRPPFGFVEKDPSTLVVTNDRMDEDREGGEKRPMRTRYKRKKWREQKPYDRCGLLASLRNREYHSESPLSLTGLLQNDS